MAVYFSKSKGCEVWDLDGNKFTDMSIMGIGTNSLGYGNDIVDAAVFEVVKNGNILTKLLGGILAEKLIEINPWAKMVRLLEVEVHKFNSYKNCQSGIRKG